MATKKQHYIPRMLLKRFTTFQIPMRKPMIYQYDKCKNIERLVDIYDVCHKKYLYEIRDESGIISDKELNLIENRFFCLESKWDRIICKIEQSQDVTQDDRCMLGVLLVLQLMRMPEFMSFASDWLYNTFINTGKPLSQNKADRYAKLASFVWGEVEPETNWMLNILFEKILDGKDVIICHSDTEFILNGDRPVLCLKLFEHSDIGKCQWYLPIAKNYCITLMDEGNPFYIDMDARVTGFINMHNFQNDSRFIYRSKSASKCYKGVEKN